MATQKRKSQRRFEQFNRIVDVIGPTLPSSSHLSVLCVAWRHAMASGEFQVSTKRIAQSCRLSTRWVKAILDELELGEVISMTKEHQGPIPRRYKITGKAFPSTANGEVEFTIKPK